VEERAIVTLASDLEDFVQVEFSPDGRMLAAGSADQRVRLWDLRTRRELPTPKRKPAGPTGLAYLTPVVFSPDGKLLAWGKNDRKENSVRLWDLAARREVATLRGSPRIVGRVLFSADGRMLATASHDRTIRLWALEPGSGWREVEQFRGFRALAYGLALSPDGRLLAGADGTESVRVWDLVTRKEIAVLPGMHTQLDWLGFTTDGKTLIVGCSDGRLRCWSTVAWAPTASLRIPGMALGSVAVSPDGDTLAVGRTDGGVRLLRAATLEEADRQVRLGRVTATGGDRRVALHWQPLPYAAGYHVYRGPVGGDGPLVKLTGQPAGGVGFVDTGPGLENGQPVRYAVAPVIRGPAGKAVEGQRATVQATPVGAPAGWEGASFNEGTRGGSAVIQPATGEIRIRGAGSDIWDEADGGFFLSRPITGDFVVTVKRLSGPTATHEHAKAGLMIREALDPAARSVMHVVKPTLGLEAAWRQLPGAGTEVMPGGVVSGIRAQPVLLRLTRRGNTVTAEHSRDGGKSYRPVGEPVTFEPPLPATLHVGLAITAHDVAKTSEARFAGLEIRQR
jgi:hypothetical protein